MYALATLIEYKCPCCGGAIEFNSSVQKLKCPFCDTEFDVSSLVQYDNDLKSEKPDEMNWEREINEADETYDDITSFVCDSCGGEIVGDKTTAATSCPFCGNPVIIKSRLSGALKPDLVIPFKLDKNAAKAKFIEHLKGKRLLPKVFKDENHIDKIQGIYVPFWLFDADADANIRYKATRVRTWSDSRYDYTETKFYSVIREGALSFDSVPVDGSVKMADDLMDSIEPYDLSEAVDFQTAYLAGYFADRYDVSSKESINRANKRIKTSTEEAFKDTVQGFATVTTESSSVSLSNQKVKYALYPVWILNTTWRNNTYTFAMNGQTGKFVGNLPLDKGAYWRWFVGMSVVAAPICTAIAYLLYRIFG